MSRTLKELYASSPLFGGNSTAVEALYEQFLDKPDSVPDAWRDYFKTLGDAGTEVAHTPIRQRLKSHADANDRAITLRPGKGGSTATEKQAAVSRLIQVYSLRGHQIADIDPLGLMERPVPGVLKLDYLGLNEADMDSEFYTGGFAGTGNKRMKLRDILGLLKSIYCGKVTMEVAHVSRARERLWLRREFEHAIAGPALPAEERRGILEQLTRAEGMERYLHTRYVGQKRFSLEGGESLIPMLDDIIHRGGAGGIHEIVIGMAHRGRINVLVNILGKSPEELFEEFEGNYDLEDLKGSGDVKYHKGFSADMETEGGNVHIALAFNPSHLEIVNPVVEGSVRARQERRNDKERGEVLPILIHGDAAFSGQGVVTETFQLSQTNGFRTGGTLHIVVNNQIGFTTSRPSDARSTEYCTDVAKMIEAPVFHVNADDPENVIKVTRLALEYRQKFKKDIVIDLVCYRRHGHNEADEPSATQPIMYTRIKQHPTTRQIYADQLVADDVLGAAEVTGLQDAYRDRLDRGEPVPEASLGMIGNEFTVDWSPHFDAKWDEVVDTSLDADALEACSAAITSVPDEMKLHGRVQRIMDDRGRMASGEIPMDWGFAEAMAYASLIRDKYSVRLVGQDAGRGTFFHRHSVLHNQLNNREYTPLRHIDADRPNAFRVIDSLLSEEAVLGFEYGYATTEADSLVIWEGQFGDFVNGAQVVIDQFISSGFTKWGRLCGMTLFLPHGYEGQGPEHSSARLERFLQLCAEHNMAVCVPSNPSQMFHMLRRQMLRKIRKPLIVMTPKSLLRHKLSTSSLDELSGGSFHLLIEDDQIDVKKTRRVVFCSGKVYYDLYEARQVHDIDDVAIVRIEQLYPFPIPEYAAVIQKYAHVNEIVWCQEEPQNQGAWYQIRHRLQEPLSAEQELFYAGREGAAAPASGVYKVHSQQQQDLVEAALDIAVKASKSAKPR